MAHIIAVVGAGGKTSLMEHLAVQYSAGKYRVAITTTTQIVNGKDHDLIRYYGKNIGGGKLGFQGEGSFQKICLENNYVLVEADDARHHPVKIPSEKEPVIPKGTERIIVVMSNFALGRCFGEICHQSELADLSLFQKEFGRFDKNMRMTKAHIDFLAKTYYLAPLREKYPDAQIEYYYNVPGKSVQTNAQQIKKLGLVLLASGPSKRFGSNKLLYELNGKALYRWGLDALLETKVRLKVSDKRLLNMPELDEAALLSDAERFGLESEVILVSCYPELLQAPLYGKTVRMVDNPNAQEGIAASIRAGCVEAIRAGCDAVLYLVADRPFVTAGNLTNMIREYLVFGKRFSCCYAGLETNPAIFHLSEREKLLALTGDEGPMEIIRSQPLDTYYYIVSKEKLLDIDEWDDLV